MSLKEIFRNENLKKIVLVDKSSNSFHARRHLVDTLGVLLNTHVLTLDQYAADLTSEIRFTRGLKQIEREQALYIIESIMNNSERPFIYFRQDIVSLNSYTEVLSTIIEMKKTGISWDDQALRGRIKLEELSRIYYEYDKELSLRGKIDEADILGFQVKASHDSIHLVYDNVSWLPLEKSFFEHCCSGEFTILPVQKPKNLPRPESYSYISNEESESPGKILKVYYGEEAAENIRIIKAYGVTNEVQGVFRDILIRELPLDKCIILYTGGEYVDYIRNSADYYGVSITLQEGYKLDNTAPYYLVSQLIWYVTNGFLTENLRPIFESNVLDLRVKDKAGEPVSNHRLMDHIKSLRVSTGADRLLKRLNNHISDCFEKLSSIEDKEKHTYKVLEEAIAIGEGLRPFFTDLAKLENLDQGTDKWLDSLRVMMNSYTEISDEERENEGESFKALEAIDNAMKSYIDSSCSYSFVSVKWLYELEQRVKGARKDLHTPTPGRLHVARYANVMLVNKPYVYVIGLDAAHFPDSRGEASILNDSDRKRISPYLGLEPRKTDAVYRLLEVLGNAKGEINLVYSYYDTVKVNEINPSTFIQSLVNKTGVVIENFSFIPESIEEALSPMEGLMLEPSRFLGLSSTKEIGLQGHGLEFLERNVFSASQIEMMASCRRKYYYRYILGLSEEREEVLGHYGWLDAADKGTLLHSILEGMVREINARENPNLEELTREICQDRFSLMEREVPCTIRQHYDSLYEKLSKAVLRYARIYAKKRENGEIIETITEKRFTETIEIRSRIESAEGTADEKAIKILLRGFIDRLDILSDGSLAIIDYKSGRKFDDSTANKEKLQDYLYSLAAKEIFSGREDISGVREARYDFPLEPLDNETWKMDPNKLEELNNTKAQIVIEALTDIADGQYHRAIDGKPCMYCSYVLHCRPHINGGEE